MREFVILDFGSQYTHLIKTRLAELGYRSDIFPADLEYSAWIASNDSRPFAGIVLSGGAGSVNDDLIPFDSAWLAQDVPVLGICYGHQKLAALFGGAVGRGAEEFGRSTLTIQAPDHPLLVGNASTIDVWMSHRDIVTAVPTGFRVLASSDYSSIAAFGDDKRALYGVQFHPEVAHTERGIEILYNFCSRICGEMAGEPWTAAGFLRETRQRIAHQVTTGRVLVALSGGVDSMTLAALLRHSLPGDQLVAVYIDTGLMPVATESDVVEFCLSQNIQLVVSRQADLFFHVLRDVTSPEEKCIAVGGAFAAVLESLAVEFMAEFVAQGTIWSDVVESGVTKFSSRIKPHHNVGGFPATVQFKLFEPLRELFKDQVRALAAELKLPKSVVARRVFPGPGFAIRVQGAVTPEKIELVKMATRLIEEVVEESPVADKIWMAFAILVDVPSLGIKGDLKVSNEQAIVVRIVESVDSLTARFSREALPLLSEISRRLTNEASAGRIVYDITDKPPGTIEWQ